MRASGEMLGIQIIDVLVYLVIIFLLILFTRSLGSSRLMLNIPTYEGSGQAIHPDILLLKKPISGYRYWMAFTPYPNSLNIYENPSIVASNDGKNWEVPKGLRNPLEQAPSEGHYSDPDIFIDEDERLWLFFRWSHGLEERIYAKYSVDGIRWSEKIAVLETDSESLISPSIVFDKVYKMWYVDIRPEPNVIKIRTAPSPLGPWSDPLKCKVNGVPDDRNIWHLDVIKVKEGYDAFILLINKGKGLKNGELYFATSKDGIEWNLSPFPILTPSSTGWDSFIIYRSSALLLSEIEGCRHYALYYSGAKSSCGSIIWHIGYTEVKICVDDEGRMKLG
jgi:hypothetical protein